jgi:hypothetical protein
LLVNAERRERDRSTLEAHRDLARSGRDAGVQLEACGIVLGARITLPWGKVEL